MKETEKQTSQKRVLTEEEDRAWIRYLMAVVNDANREELILGGTAYSEEVSQTNKQQNKTTIKEQATFLKI